MRRAVPFSFSFAFVVAACGGHAYDHVSTTQVTSASAVAGEGGSVTDRIARTICIHEVECGRVREPAMCVDAARARIGSEVSAWTCDEEATRVGAEQCLATLREASCSVDLASRSRICPQNGGCASIESDPAASR